MKRLILFAFVSVAVTMVSCRKDITCTCTAEVTSEYTTTTGGKTVTTTSASTRKTTDTHENVSKKNANLYEDCSDRTEVDTYKGTSGSSAYTNITTSVYTCELK